MGNVQNSEKTESQPLQKLVKMVFNQPRFLFLPRTLSPWSSFNLGSLKVNIIWIGTIHFVSGHLIYPA